MTTEQDKDLNGSWAWWQPLVGLVVVVALVRLLRMWFPDLSFGAIFLIIIPIVVVVRVALLVGWRKSARHPREREHDSSPESNES